MATFAFALADSPRKLASQRQQCPQPGIAQVQPAPDQYAENDWHENVREKWIADAHMGSNRAAKIACKQDRAKNGGARNHIE